MTPLMPDSSDITSSEGQDFIFKLDAAEDAWWNKEIQIFRKRIIKDSFVYLAEAAKKIGLSLDTLNADVDAVIRDLRSTSYNLYLIDEANFHSEIARHLTNQRDLPKNIMRAVIKPILARKDFPNMTAEALTQHLGDAAGQYVGRIFPYLYVLSLSTTQSRRSRAGTEFELILKTVLDLLGYPCEAQSQIGSSRFAEVRLGKSVDLLVPGIEGYRTDPQECAVITAKTTLRERWTQVAEELQRTNVPRIYLVTPDDQITSDVLERLHLYKITLVVPNILKNTQFETDKLVHSFSTFFMRDIPHIIDYWKRAKN